MPRSPSSRSASRSVTPTSSTSPSRKPRRPTANSRLLTPTLDSSDPGTPPFTAPPSTRGPTVRRRGRPPLPGSGKNARNRGGPSHYTQVPRDLAGNEQFVSEDEIVLPEDNAGERKVSKMGLLLGGREYRCRTFTILGRGERLYMLSTEPARCIGFRDSYLFFQKHRQLFKIILDDDEKHDLIARNVIPHSYKGRAIGVVTARSVFREFGARIVVGGRVVEDDYWEGRLLREGAKRGELADPDDRLPKEGEEYNRNQYVAWHGASSVYHTGQPSVPQRGEEKRKRRVVVTETNWMTESAKSAIAFNTRLQDYRNSKTSRGIYDPHSNIMHYRTGTQPTLSKREGIDGAARADDSVVVETVMVSRPWPGYGLGVGKGEMQSGFGDWLGDDVVAEALRAGKNEEGVVDVEASAEREKLVGAVREQVGREREWRGRW